MMWDIYQVTIARHAVLFVVKVEGKRQGRSTRALLTPDW